MHTSQPAFGSRISPADQPAYRFTALKFHLVVLVGLSCVGPVFAQTVPDPRLQPAPWRPAFAPAVQSPDGDQGTLILSQQNQLNQNTGGQNSNDRNTGSWNQTPRSNSGTRQQRTTDNGLASTVPALQTPPIGNGNSPETGTRPGMPAARVASNNPFNERTSVDISRDRNMLPNSAGQIWREYDISPYTSRIQNVDHPQQAIVEWILLETGTEMWFNQPLGILNAEKDRLYVYHTPEIHDVVRPIVDRFVRTRGQAQNLDVSLCTVDNPNWRSQAYNMLQPVEVQSPGVEAWMISKENAAILYGQLARRGDFKQHSGGRVTVNEGQHVVIEKTTPVQFVQSIRWTPTATSPYQPLLSTIDSGYRLSVSLLSAGDGNNIEATIKCDVDQVEKLTPVNVQVPDYATGQAGQMTLNIPQLVSWKLHERFRWPDDQVLLLSCGVVARPDEAVQFGNRPALFGKRPGRADALLFIEYRGPADEAGRTSAQVPALVPVQR